MFFRILLLILVIEASGNVTADRLVVPKMPDEAAYVYGQPLNQVNILNTLSMLLKGKYSTHADTRLFSPGMSLCIYIPYRVLLADSARKILITGYQDHVELFRREKPLLRIGLKLLIESHFPKFRLFEANCRYSLPDSFPRKAMSITMLGFDPEHEQIEPADITRIRGQSPKSKLIIYAGNLPKKSVSLFHELGVFVHISKQASIDELIKCLEAAQCASKLSLA
ncbi:hypothetical protein [Dyadobacter endophyticus]|uniref:hypothetical protein n=1 Tax=Dyadobacter endophyticus TaxID=1749036 RepID=UPI0016677A24|nr:hypothetical protein [Dyadobacter endophyticus]